MAVRTVTTRGRSLMKVLTEASLRDVKAEVDDMTAEEARDIWAQVEPFFPGVCARASSRKRGVAWLELVRKMDLVRRKAEGEG